MNTVQKTILDFEKAVQHLEEALQRESRDELIHAGCIQYFEFTFELSWKLMKLIGLEEGLMNLETPFDCIRAAFRKQWIQEEKLWLDMLNARNKMTHTYSSEKAEDIYLHLRDFLTVLKTFLGDITYYLSQRDRP